MLLAALTVLLASAPAASASFQFVTQWGSYGSGDGQFGTYPAGVATDAAGSVYVADAGNYRIQKFDSAGNFLRKWGSYGSGDGQFGNPAGVATDSAGNVYVADASNYRIEKFDSAGNFLRKWGSYGTGDGQFYYATGVATDSAGNVYVVDESNSRIQKFDSAGNFLRKWGSYGSGDGQFGYPAGVATDSAGNVYVADTDNNRIQKFDSAGNFLRKWGSYGTGDGQFLFPVGVATDSAGNVYVVDESNSRIQKFDSAGNFLAKAGSYGSGDGQFVVPVGAATDSAGNVYVVDSFNRRIEKFRQLTDTTINSGPAGPTNDASPSFAFASPEPGATFQCRLDSNQEADYRSCSSPKLYSSLPDGIHRFEVRANSPMGYSGPPASRTFTVDTLPPDTTISGPDATNDPTPRFYLFSTEGGPTFECKVDSGPYAGCGSPTTMAHLTDGPHTLYVRAIDEANNADPTPATHAFAISTASVSVSGTTLVVTAVRGATDNLSITRPYASTLRVTDLPSGAYGGSGVHGGPGCTQSGDYTANCTGEIARIQVTAGDQADRVTNSTGVRSTLYGGKGADTLVGGPSADTLVGGPSADTLKGMNGNDQLLARDFTSDTLINCDGGIGTPGNADKADLDLLPKDPSSVVTGCETKTRH